MMTTKIPGRVAIDDPYLIRRIGQEKERRGDSTFARTAACLLVERLTLLEATRCDVGDNEGINTMDDNATTDDSEAS